MDLQLDCKAVSSMAYLEKNGQTADLEHFQKNKTAGGVCREKVHLGSVADSVLQICSSLGSSSRAGQTVIKAKMRCFVKIN